MVTQTWTSWAPRPTSSRAQRTHLLTGGKRGPGKDVGKCLPAPELGSADPPAHRWEARPRGRTWGSAFLLQNSAQRIHLLTGGKRGPGEGRGEVPSCSRTRLPPGVIPPGANPPGVTPLGDTPALRRTGSWPPGALSLVETDPHSPSLFLLPSWPGSFTPLINPTGHHQASQGCSGKEPACECRRRERCGFDPWVGKIPWRRAGQPTPVFLPGESHGQRSLVGRLQSMGPQRVGHA